MNLRKFSFAIISLFVVIVSCKKDDDITTVPDRDRLEVYFEDIEEIETFLETHYYNYEEFEANAAYSLVNDEFEIVIDTISVENGTQDKIPLILQVDSETIIEDGISYKLYFLKVREGLGAPLHGLDRAVVTYNGSLSNGDTFDSAVTPVSFNLTTVGQQGGVVDGFREGLTEFKTSDDYTENTDGSVIYHNHGIGMIFIPSGIGYFSSSVGTIPAYSPIFFKFNLINRLDTDFDLDGVPSHLEDLDGDGSGQNDNTDGDSFVNFIDNDDDGDGVLTRDEDIDEDGDPTNDDTNGNGIPNYLDPTSVETNQN